MEKLFLFPVEIVTCLADRGTDLYPHTVTLPVLHLAYGIHSLEQCFRCLQICNAHPESLYYSLLLMLSHVK